jgi:hypothetical protein
MYTLTSKLAVCFVLMAVSAAAQQQAVMTNGGTTNTVPLFTGSSAIGNSVITQSNGNVGIGMSTPNVTLHVNGFIQTSAMNTGFVAMTLGNKLATSGNKGWDIRANADVSPWNGTPDSLGFEFWNGTTDVFPLTLTSSNYVGINNTNPTQRLSITNGSLNFDNFGFASSYRGPTNNFTNLFLGGSLFDNGNGSYAVQTDGGSNYFAAIRMDNYGANAGAINFYTGATTGGTSYALTNAQLANYLRMSIIGNSVGIGTTTPGAMLEVNGNIKLTSGSGASITFADGTVQSTASSGVGGTCGGDYAESVDVSGNRISYEPGDVLVISGDAASDVTKSTEAYSTLVAGIYSTKPAVVGRRQISDPRPNKTEIPMAMVGIVPTKVSAENGPIDRGDLLVTSSTRGYAMKGTDRDRMLGAVIGKALGNLDFGKAVIEVLVTLQ